MKIISGGQTGVDQAALRAARACGLPTGGYAAKGWQTEDGPAPWLADFGLVQCDRPGYPARTAANIRAAGATIILLSDDPPTKPESVRSGTALTLRLCQEAHRAGHHVYLHGLLRHPELPAIILDFLTRAQCGDGFISVVNVAGPRESKCPGVGAFTQSLLHAVFAKLAGLCEV